MNNGYANDFLHTCKKQEAGQKACFCVQQCISEFLPSCGVCARTHIHFLLPLNSVHSFFCFLLVCLPSKLLLLFCFFIIPRISNEDREVGNSATSAWCNEKVVHRTRNKTDKHASSPAVAVSWMKNVYI